MARRIRPVALFVLAAVLAASPAFAQFGSIFSDPPRRPPADVPSAPPPPYYPSGRDTPPSQPLPAPMNLPPSNRPGAGGIQSQPLPPPPGGIVAPAPPPGQRPQQDVSTPSQPPTALPPGPGSPRNVPQQANTAPQPSDEVVVEPPPQRINNPTAVFSGSRQDHRTHHFVRCRDQRNRAVRRAPGDAARLLLAAADRNAQYRRLHRGRRDHAAGRDQARCSPAGCSLQVRACTRSSIRSTTCG